LGYAVDADGTGLLLFGSANPDSEVYALNAVTGALVWRYATYSPSSEDWDVGAGVSTSAPGVNGFADGMAYVDGKDGILFGLDLTTGALVWQFNFGGNSPTNPVATGTDALSTP
jgi:outer membrane protein assembly factor BamB